MLQRIFVIGGFKFLLRKVRDSNPRDLLGTSTSLHLGEKISIDFLYIFRYHNTLPDNL